MSNNEIQTECICCGNRIIAGSHPPVCSNDCKFWVEYESEFHRWAKAQNNKLKDFVMTKEEKWFNRLKGCLKEMPESVEVAIANEVIVLLPRGAVDRSFKKHGSVDYFSDEEIDSFRCKKVLTCSESL